MDPNQQAQALAKQRQDLGQRVASIPNQFNPATDPTVNALRGQQSEKLKQLFAHDQQLADVNFKPVATPAGPGEVVPESAPRLVDPTIGLRASSQQTQATAAEAGDILRQIETRKDLLSFEREKAYSALDRLIELNDREQRALEKRMEMEANKQESKANNLISVLSEIGGTITPEMEEILGIPGLAGKYFKSKAEQTELSDSEQSAEKARKSLQDEVNKYGKFHELVVRYGAELPEYEIRNIYNKGLGAKIWGPAKETSADVIRLQTEPKSSKSSATARDLLKKQSGIDVIGQIEKVDKKIKGKTGTATAIGIHTILQTPAKALIRGKDPTALADLETKYFLLVQSVLTAIQGSRPSDYDVKSYQDKAGPSIYLSPEVNESRIKTLLALLESSIGKTPEKTTNTRPSLDSFIK